MASLFVTFLYSNLLSCATVTPIQTTTCASCHPEQSALYSPSHHRHSENYTATGWSIGVEIVQGLKKEQRGKVFATTTAIEASTHQPFIALNLENNHPGLLYNSQCAPCHSTGVSLNYLPKTDEYNTQIDAHYITCEACHDHDGPKASCQSCHSLRKPLTIAPSASFFDSYLPALPDSRVFGPRVTSQGETFTFLSFQSSKHALAGLSCVDCHDPHSAKLKHPKSPCEVCHQNTSHHKEHQPALSCVQCHLPTVQVFERQTRHDHRLDKVRPCQPCHSQTPLHPPSRSEALTLLTSPSTPPGQQAEAALLLTLPRETLENNALLQCAEGPSPLAALACIAQLGPNAPVAGLTHPLRAIRYATEQAFSALGPATQDTWRANPDQPQSWFEQGLLHARQGDFTDGERWAMRLARTETEQNLLLATRLFLRLNKPAMALATLHRTKSKSPEQSLVYVQILIALKKIEDAAKELNAVEPQGLAYLEVAAKLKAAQGEVPNDAAKSAFFFGSVDTQVLLLAGPLGKERLRRSLHSTPLKKEP